MQAQAEFWVNLFSGQPRFPLILKVGPSPDIKKLFWRLPLWEDALLSAPKVIIFLSVSSSKLQKSAPSNVVPYLLYTYFSLSLLLYYYIFLYHYHFTILVGPNKQVLNLRLLVGSLHRQCKHLKFWSSNCFVLQLKDLYQILLPFYDQKVLCYVRKQYTMA